MSGLLGSAFGGLLGGQHHNSLQNAQNAQDQASAFASITNAQNAYMQNAQNAQNAMGTLGGISNAQNAMGASITNSTSKMPNSTPTAFTADLDHPLYGVPIRVLKDMWWAKHSTQWTALVMPIEDPDWRIIFQRLKKALEEVYLQDKGHTVYRLPQE